MKSDHGWAKNVISVASVATIGVVLDALLDDFACHRSGFAINWFGLVESAKRGNPMEFVGSFEAKTHLAQLLDRVAKGEEITITRHGKPVAMLVPADPVSRKPEIGEVIDEMRAFRKGNTLGGKSSIRELIEEGRRF